MMAVEVRRRVAVPSVKRTLALDRFGRGGRGGWGEPSRASDGLHGPRRR